jgi:pyruvate carboxylase subunit B
MKYLVAIGAHRFEVVVDGDQVTVGGRTVRAELEVLPGSPEVRLLVDGRSTLLAVDGLADGVWRLVDRGAVREVAVEDERSRHIRLLAGAGKADTGSTVLKSPMPGLVVRIPATPGQVVAAGTPLVVLEAMKMENELKAQSAGVVVAIRVTPGQAVEKGQVLLELGPAG